jgi:hypothetical protein
MGHFIPQNTCTQLDSHKELFFFRSMSEARSNNQVDPNRFTGKKFTRRQTFPNTSNDFAVKIDGLTAGRVMKKNSDWPASGLALDPDRALFPWSPINRRGGRVV